MLNDVRYMTYEYKKPVQPMFWVSEAQSARFDDPAFQSGEIWSHYLYNIVLWAPGKQPDIEMRVRKALAGVDPNLVLYGVDPYSKVVGADFQQQRLIATLISLFGVLGLVLAAVGLFGVLAYIVERRTGEIGVRMAFGRRSWPRHQDGFGRCIRAGADRARYRHPRRDRRRETDDCPAIRGPTLGSIYAGGRRIGARLRSSGCLADSRLARLAGRADGGAAYRITNAGSTSASMGHGRG